MKKILISLAAITLFFSCRRETQCVVVIKSDPNNVLDTIVSNGTDTLEIINCRCTKKDIERIEKNLDYNIDSLNGADSTVEYNITCD